MARIKASLATCLLGALLVVSGCRKPCAKFAAYCEDHAGYVCVTPKCLDTCAAAPEFDGLWKKAGTTIEKDTLEASCTALLTQVQDSVSKDELKRQAK